MAMLYWQPSSAANPSLTAAEEVSFVPHPKTMTKAGEWEYFAAGSQHPFPYAVAELIDNSLRATRHNAVARKITVTLVSSSGPGQGTQGLVSVWDNGSGMSLRQLNEWAVMNLTMEDRGLQPKEIELPRHAVGTAAAKQLCSDLSFFGVGSKNAGMLPTGQMLDWLKVQKSGSLYGRRPIFKSTQCHQHISSEISQMLDWCT